MPPPPSGYRFAADDYLYAPRPDEEPAPAPAPAPEAPPEVVATGPKMVWSEARSKWEPAAPPVPFRPPPVLPPPPPRPFPPAQPMPPVPPPPWPGYQSAPRQRRPRPIRRLVVIMIAVVVFGNFLSHLADSSSPDGVGPAGDWPMPTFNADPSFGPPPAPTVPVPDIPPAVPKTVADLLGTQIAGVRAGKESWFVGTVDPKATAAVATYKRMFANVRALHASGFTESSDSDLDSIQTEAFVRVTVSFCIGGISSPCALTSVSLDLTVGPRGGGVAIVAVALAADFEPVAPPPWFATPLTVKTGGNVLVAASSATRSQLDKVLAAAETAGTRADAYSSVPTPRVYVVYLASHADVTAWFGDHGIVSHGVVDAPLGTDQVALVLPEATTTGPKGGDGLAADLQRALAVQALALDDSRFTRGDTMIAGLPAYAAYDGLDPVADDDTLAPAANYVLDDDWDRSCFYTDDAATTQEGLDAMPGIGLLALRYLVQRYTFDLTMQFWDYVVRAGAPPEMASRWVFKTDWSSLDEDCATSVVRAVGT